MAKSRILVVDDTPANIKILADLLRKDYLLSVATSGADALQIAGSEDQPDLVLLDIMMPEMDGYETTRAIRQLEAFANLPIIAVTAKAMRGDRQKCLEAGASDYIAKPVDREQLRSLLRVWLGRQPEPSHEPSAS
jgi:CheY-like chemotaxis protein